MQYAKTLPLEDREVVLTFDDGPLPKYSNQILDILAAHCAKATFFLVGRQANANPEGVRKVRDAGHTVAGVAHLADAFGIVVGLPSHQEESRLRAMGGENVQNLIAVFRQRAVIEGQHHLVVLERQRLAILHGADDGILTRIDHNRARRADGVGMSGAVGGRGGLCGDPS